MDYRELREVMKFLHCKGLMPKDIYADMCETLGDSAPSYAMVKKWVTEFRKGRVSTEDLVRSGRPRDVSTYENVDFIRNLIKEDERVTVQDIAKYVGISFGSVHAILSKLLEMVKVSGIWVPRRVTNERKMARLEFCKEILAWYRVNPSRLVQQTVIDDAWMYHFERTEILFQPPSSGGDPENGDDEPLTTGILNKVLTGELKHHKTLGRPPEMVETDVGRGSQNGGKISEVLVKPESKKVSEKSESDEEVTSTTNLTVENGSSIKSEDIKPDSSVQDVKIGSTDSEMPSKSTDSPGESSSVSKTDNSDEAECMPLEVECTKTSSMKVDSEKDNKSDLESSHNKCSDGINLLGEISSNISSSENNCNKVDSTRNKSDAADSSEICVKETDEKVTNGNALSSVPNILAILGQRPVNGAQLPGIHPLIPIMGPHGVTLGQLSGAQFANMALLTGTNFTQLANLAGVNPLLAGTNMAQFQNANSVQPFNPCVQQTLVQAPSGGVTNSSPSAQKRSGNEQSSLPKKKQRKERPPSETSCVFWDSEGVILVETLEPGVKLTGELYGSMLVRLKEAIDAKRPGALERGVLLMEDQAPAGAKPPRGVQLLPLPVNSPDLSPSDFHIFPKVKEHLRGRQVAEEGLTSIIEKYLETQDEGYFKIGLTEMERRCTLCVDLNGDYVEK